MSEGRRSRFRQLAILLLLTAVPAAALAGEELVLPDNLFFYRSVASVWGQGSIWINPAALSSRQTGRMIMFAPRAKRMIRDWGVAYTLKFGGSAYRHISGDRESDVNEYIFAFGGGRRTSYGFSYRYIKDGPDHLNRRHLWTIGFLSRQTRNLAIGARFENLNRGRIDGRQSDIRFVYGLAARAYRDRLTLSFEVDQTRSESLRQADFRTGLEIRPKPGLFLFADFDNHSRFNLGVRLNFGRQYLGHYHKFDRDAKSVRSTTYIGSVEGRQTSLKSLGYRTLSARLDGRLPENQKIPYFGKKPLNFFDHIDGIYRAADDDGIDRLFLRIGSLRCGMGKVEELTAAIEYFQSRHKPVIAYLAEPNNLGYLLASAADTVLIPPVSVLTLMGLRAELKTYKGLLDKIGVEAEIERVEDYKTAPERYMFDEPSEPSRIQINRILDRLYDNLVAVVAENRRLSADSVKTLIDRAPLTSIEAKACGLVDDTCYLEGALDTYGGAASPIYGGRISLSKYLRPPEYHDRWGRPDRLALVIAEGDITAGNSGGRIGEFEMLAAIKKARQDGSVRGVLLRINSPGGSALASDLIWHEIEETSKKKPLVISMGNVAASGGYYIGAVDGPIFVNHSTITGSIGVYAGKVNLTRLYDKIGIYTESHTRGKNAGMFSFSEPFTPEQRLILKSHLIEFYDHFVSKVAAARSLAPDSIDALARGRVWTGTEALEIGLADTLGGLHQAMEHLRRTCGLRADELEIVSYPRQYYLFDNPYDIPEILSIAAGKLFGGGRQVAALNLLETDRIFFRMPYDIVIE